MFGQPLDEFGASVEVALGVISSTILAWYFNFLVFFQRFLLKSFQAQEPQTALLEASYFA